jgi:hypothetical protein
MGPSHRTYELLKDREDDSFLMHPQLAISGIIRLVPSATY